MKTRITTYAALLLSAAAVLTACDTGTSSDSNKPAATASASSTPSATAEQDLTQEQKDNNLRSAGIPPSPTGAKRAELLRALAAVNPDIVKYEEKAIDAARNQCSSINSGGQQRLDWAASQRFTYKDVTTTEAQGKAINDALKASGFCKL